MAERGKDKAARRKALWAAAARRIFAPVVRALLEEGLAWPELVRVFEEATADALRQRGRRVPSQVAASLKEAAARAERPLPEADELDAARARSAQGLHLVGRWLADRRFTTRRGPRSLPLSGPRSFATLASMTGVDPEQALRVLVETGVARVEGGRRVVLTRAAYVPRDAVEEQIEMGVSSVVELIRTVLHNVRAGPRRDRFLQRRASYDNVPPELLPAVREAIRKAATAAVLEANRVMASADRDRSGTSEAGGRTRVSLGVYCYDEPVRERKRSRAVRSGRGSS